jgi:hypothetical protein
MGSNGAGDPLPYALVQIILRRDGKILHGATAFTDEVIMLIDRGVVPTNPLAKIQLADLTLFFEDVQVAVDGPERDSRQLLADAFIDPLGRRVRRRSSKDLVDLLSLSASFCSRCLHGFDPKDSRVCQYINPPLECQETHFSNASWTPTRSQLSSV